MLMVRQGTPGVDPRRCVALPNEAFASPGSVTLELSLSPGDPLEDLKQVYKG